MGEIVDKDLEWSVDEPLDEQPQNLIDEAELYSDPESEPEPEPEPEPATGTITVPASVIEIISKAPSGQHILQTCIDLAVFLASKNIAYGDSALNPVRAFSKASPTEQLLVRIDDKINRLVNGQEFPGDDDIVDLTGYLILYLVARGNDGVSNQE